MRCGTRKPQMATVGRELDLGATTELRRALKRDYFPHLAERGFTIDERAAPHFMDFRRIRGERLHFINLQWEKYGRPRFKFSFGMASCMGTVSHGEAVSPEDVDPGSAPSYCCLYPTGDGSRTAHWFRQDQPLLKALFTGRRLRPVEDVVGDLLRLDPQVEQFFETGRLGRNCRQTVNRWAEDAA
jgi:hypothetical protein